MMFTGKNNEFFEVVNISAINCELLKQSVPSELKLAWFKSDNNRIKIDNVNYTFNTNDIVCLTEFQKVEILSITSTQLIRWNKHFYCIVNHDSEVSSWHQIMVFCSKFQQSTIRNQHFAASGVV